MPFSTEVEVTKAKVMVKIFTAKEEKIMSKAIFSIGQLDLLKDKQKEVLMYVKSGALSIDKALAGTQAILENEVILKASKVPKWYSQPEIQIHIAKTFYEKHGNGQIGYRPCDIDALALPKDELNEDEVYLLYSPLKTLHETFNSLCSDIRLLKGFEKRHWLEIKSDAEHLRMVPGTKFDNQCKWVIFNPKANQGKSPKQCIDNPVVDQELAHVHILMATNYFEGWATGWNGKKSPYPNISGIQLRHDSNWSDVPSYINRGNGHHRLGLCSCCADCSNDRWSSPVFRNCT